jgi:hypothetical protein
VAISDSSSWFFQSSSSPVAVPSVPGDAAGSWLGNACATRWMVAALFGRRLSTCRAVDVGRRVLRFGLASPASVSVQMPRELLIRKPDALSSRAARSSSLTQHHRQAQTGRPGGAFWCSAGRAAAKRRANRAAARTAVRLAAFGRGDGRANHDDAQAAIDAPAPPGVNAVTWDTRPGYPPQCWLHESHGPVGSPDAEPPRGVRPSL